MNRPSIILIASTCVCLLGCSDTTLTAPDLANADGIQLEKKGGKPGGGEETPPGLIYASIGGDQVETDGDGAVLRTLDSGVKGHVTTGSYGGTRWFTYTEEVGGVYPDSTRRRGLFAVNESRDVYTLINDPLFDPSWDPRWSPDSVNVQIAFTGRRFSSPTAAADEGGIYVADVSLDAGVVTNLHLRIAGVMTESPTRCTVDGVCYAEADHRFGDWSPDGSQLAYMINESPEELFSPFSLYIENGSPSFIVARISSARWSTQDLLLFRRASAERSTFVTRLMTIDLNGSNETEVVKLQDQRGQYWTSKRFRGHEWSPDGNHFVYAWRESDAWSGTIEAELVRRKADGSGKKLLASSYATTAHGWR